MARAKTRYRVRYERDEDGWWVATVESVQGCHTQGRSIAQARERIREAMGACDLPEDAELDEEIRTGTRLDTRLRELRALREQVEKLSKQSTEATRKLAQRLADEGISRRDVGELVGVSFQRVQQIVK